MFNRLFNYLFERRQEDEFQQGCRDHIQGKLPRSQDSSYLRGYLANRPQGLDDQIQYFLTVEAYLQWKQRSKNNFLK